MNSAWLVFVGKWTSTNIGCNHCDSHGLSWCINWDPVDFSGIFSQSINVQLLGCSGAGFYVESLI